MENTYLSIFQSLGGLGLLLGSVGLCLVVLRNVLDRSGELGMLWATGFEEKRIKRMICYEHAGLLAAGLVCGLLAALVAVGGAMKSGAADAAYGSVAMMVVVVAAGGLGWIWIAATFALARKPLDALRNE